MSWEEGGEDGMEWCGGIGGIRVTMVPNEYVQDPFPSDSTQPQPQPQPQQGRCCISRIGISFAGKADKTGLVGLSFALVEEERPSFPFLSFFLSFLDGVSLRPFPSIICKEAAFAG